jgi:hypothetical protein
MEDCGSAEKASNGRELRLQKVKDYKEPRLWESCKPWLLEEFQKADKNC